MVICLERRADLHMAQLMPLPLTISCFNKIQIGFTFLVPAHLGNPGKRAIKRVCVCCIYSVPFLTISARISQNFKRSHDLNALLYCRTLIGVMAVLFTFSQQTKFEMSSFICCKDMAWVPKCRDGSHDPDRTHLGIGITRLNASRGQLVYEI